MASSRVTPLPSATNCSSDAPVNFGRMCENRPELWVEVVEAHGAGRLEMIHQPSEGASF